MIRCDACEGTGILGFQRETCWFCSGKGQIENAKGEIKMREIEFIKSFKVSENEQYKIGDIIETDEDEIIQYFVSIQQVAKVI